MVRIGVVGLGMMGTMHIASYKKIPGAQLVAICDQDPKKAAGDFSGNWGNIEGGIKQMDMTGLKGTTRLDELLAMEDLDVVDICLPTPFHVEPVLAALKAGKHVMCEKPMARTSAEARKIADAAAGSDKFFMPAMCMRFWPHWVWIKQAVADRRYGKVLGASFYRMAAMPPGWFGKGEWSGGALLDLHIHDTDFVYHLFGKPQAVFSRGYAKTSGCTDHIVTQYLYDGADAPKLVSATGGWCMADGFPFRCRALVNFENATAVFDMTEPKPLVVCQGGKTEEIKFEGDGWAAELAYFVDCVGQGRKPTVVTAADAVASIQIVEAEQKSIESGQIVSL